ncbi:MAG: bifunctional 2-polyprenyl-6-hydroxyphenol methylase/3-demethylubiquinol 3-O-methyltransferase UbiG [Bauldia sp.]|uniref:bifunctional 2-polyprenyl-6-hydroxyphenol methylase/3-demethylubiquinol 3-O-methyltransferase UbiG n=1 Tax=Bauldia sp. TaxID=2575872 RepID=UPI001DCA4588|nr:bifunctional 2-polyprenyl-6-hydroxyphenol methylase/3-demethylubiquinol 3-O-methyltransferase UbiG [Bauldia sp.]MCB1494145.1 bifunctional 2-polyprenyl-6-hydroxyphenol methylase/3-demethylubiquinol 3-O-methyltransferase UbiG [Bauldia sp.]
MSASTTIDRDEVARFSALAGEWWDPKGPMAPLHRLNPVRLGYVKDQACRHFDGPGDGARRDPGDPHALAGLSILDIGCGAGLVSEPLTRMGASVTGIDPSAENIEVARRHAADGGLAVDYRAVTAEQLGETGATWDVVLALEVVEHVPDVDAFVAAAGALIRPGGLLIASTINRTMKALALAIVGAEYVLRWLPRGTHSYDRLVTPSELGAAFRAAGLTRRDETGVVYVPLADRWKLSPDTGVNYMMVAGKPIRPAYQGNS